MFINKIRILTVETQCRGYQHEKHVDVGIEASVRHVVLQQKVIFDLARRFGACVVEVVLRVYAS